MIRTEQFVLTSSHEAWGRLCVLSNHAARVRNQALYRMRRQWETEGGWSEPAVRKSMRADEFEHYMALPQKLARETSRLAGRDLSSYARARKAGYAARLPRYLPHTGRSVLIFSAHDQLSRPALRRGVIKVGGVDMPLAASARFGKVLEVRVLPRKHTFIVEVVHETRDPRRATGARVAGLDLGIDNLAAVIVDEPGVRPLLVSGRQLKSINQGYNRLRARYSSQLPTGVRSSARIEALTARRNAAVKALCHAASRTVVNYLVANGVGELHVGWNEGFKTGPSQMGVVFNQRFRQLPLRVFLEQVVYKAEAAGITVIETEESYTSKTSLLDREAPVKHETYAGKRVKRGLFRASDGRAINADVNGAGQIVRKSKPDAFQWMADGVEAKVVPAPVRVRVGGWPSTGKSVQKKSERRDSTH